MNDQPLHLDEEWAKKTPFGQRVVNGLLTLSMSVGMSVGDLTAGTLVANLGYYDVEHAKPVFHGDTIRVETTVVSVRDSRSKPDRGIVEFEHRAFNQHGVLVAKCTRQAMMLKRPA
jgi:acyl dehydratase